MKYIRTKNGVLFPTNTHEEDIPKDDCFFKVGDTIEELCHECVINCCLAERDDEGNIPWERIKRIAQTFPNAKIYGAIWTDKGLIYVAKMNDKGELELL